MNNSFSNLVNDRINTWLTPLRLLNDWTPVDPATSMPVDIYTDDNCWYLEAELPGVANEDIEVTAENGILRIVADRKITHRGVVSYSERHEKHFDRMMLLSETLDATTVRANLHNGVLTVTLNKKPETKPRRIAVVNGDGQDLRKLSGDSK